eukprot:3607669-Pyramimonas_sp.AAC.1
MCIRDSPDAARQSPAAKNKLPNTRFHLENCHFGSSGTPPHIPDRAVLRREGVPDGFSPWSGSG